MSKDRNNIHVSSHVSNGVEPSRNIIESTGAGLLRLGELDLFFDRHETVAVVIDELVLLERELKRRG